MAGVGVDLVVLPGLLIVIHMDDDHAYRGNPFIPLHALAVVQHIVFITVALVVDDVTLATALQRLHGVDVLSAVHLHGRAPTSHPTLIASVAARAVAIAVIAACSQDIVIAHAFAFTLSVVEVRETEAVAELMAEDAYAHQLAMVVQLMAAGIGVDGYPV